VAAALAIIHYSFFNMYAIVFYSSFFNRYASCVITDDALGEYMPNRMICKAVQLTTSGVSPGSLSG
jgi:hypothetical protein